MSDLIPEELPLAQKMAYLRALTRGNGQSPPPYDRDQAIGDFWQAAGEVIAQRTPVEVALAAFHYKVIVPLFADITRTLEVACYISGDENHGSNFVGNGAVLSGLEAVAQFTDQTSAEERQRFAEEAQSRYKALDNKLKKYVLKRYTKVDGSSLAKQFMKRYFGEPIDRQKELGVPIINLIWGFRNSHLHAFYPYYRTTFDKKVICGGVRWLYMDPVSRVGIRISQLESDFEAHKHKLYSIKDHWFLICPQVVFVYFKRAVARFIEAIRKEGDEQNVSTKTGNG